MRIRKVSSVREMERVIDEMITLGYDVQQRGEETALLKEKTWGSVTTIIVLTIVACIFAYFTVFLSFILPIAYVIYAHQTAEIVEIKVDRSMGTTGSEIQPEAQAQPPTSQTSATGKVCISCNSVNEQNAAYCLRCGARILGGKGDKSNNYDDETVY